MSNTFKCVILSRVMNMAFDGIVIANIRQELEQTLLGGRLYKIAQPEDFYDELGILSGSRIVARKNGKYGYLDKNLEEMTEFVKRSNEIMMKLAK